MSKFTIIDGSGLLFRSYYGLPALSDDYGENTQMIFGMAKMTLKLMSEKPDYFAIARDVGGKTARHDMDENYKANREQAPDELIRQFHLSHQMISDLRIPAFGFPGYEADDVINTWVQKAKAKDGTHATIVSSDKDLKQLICQNIDSFDPMKNKKTNYLQFKMEFGFEPELLADYLALIGDTSDNIPGVAGIGPKSATDLIREYGTVENIYNNIEHIKKSVQTKLLAGQELAFSSKVLVNLMLVPEMNHLTIEESCTLNPDFDLIRHILLDTHGFHSLSKTIDDLEKKYSKVAMQGLFG
ncbi:DNA polymerase I [candidate division SR1 bacterium Aalborg_AAW-1]|nr:DNA polymerase I [candidate division SR1 bacterium Aalborg_AAW-1]